MSQPQIAAATADASGEVHLRAQRALESSPVFGLRNLTVEWITDALVISGTVASFYHKQLAQEIVRAIAASTRIVNQVQVNSQGEESGYPVRNGLPTRRDHRTTVVEP